MARRRAFARWIDSPFVKGAAIGYVASKALDSVSVALYNREAQSTRDEENAARRYRHVYEVAVDQLARLGGRQLDREEQQIWGWRFHQATGILAGLGYAVMRRRNPRIGAAMGLLFGTSFFLIMDELMMPLLRWSPGPRAFSWKVHARGAAAHIAYGVAAEATARALDRATAAI
jgi:Protein of unknown function (DUF1440)